MDKRLKLLSLLPLLLILTLFCGLSPYSGLAQLTHGILNPIHQITGIPRSWPFFAGEPFWLRYKLHLVPSGEVLIPRKELPLLFIGVEREKNIKKSILTSWTDDKSRESIASWICRYHSNVPKGKPVQVGYTLTDLEHIKKKIAEGSVYSFYFSHFLETREKTIEVKCLD